MEQAMNGHCLTLARAFGGLAASGSWPPFFSLQALGNKVKHAQHGQLDKG